jgi:hypothetical protein
VLTLPQLMGYNGVVSYLPAKRAAVVVFRHPGAQGQAVGGRRLGDLQPHRSAVGRRASPSARAPLFAPSSERRWGQVCPETAGINAQGDTARFRQLDPWMKLAATIHSGTRDAPPDPWHRSWGISS